MLCSNCLLEIDEDSTYCDQCGKPVMICPECGYIGIGKICPNDGTKLVLNNESKNYLAKNFFKTERIKQKQHSSVIKLINRHLGIELQITNGDIVGRTSIKFSQTLSELKQISSKHVAFSCAEENWTITDLGSTNGTKLNGKPLTPQQPEKIKQGDSLVLANVEFYVTVDLKVI